jgi:alanine dehydrogenase
VLINLLMLILSEKEVQSLIDIRELIEALEQAHIQYSTGNAVMPVRLVVPLPQIQGRITSMPGYLSDDKALGMKIVTYFQNNPRQNLPAILATIMLFSTETGKMIAAMDGSYITAVRTAAASAMATKALANPQTPVLGIVGAGVQARAHIRALCFVRNFKRIKIYSPSGTSAMAVKRDLEPEVDVDIEVAGSVEEAVQYSDLVVTVTTAQEPILSLNWLTPGAHINAVGSHRPDLREIDGATLASSKVVVDSREAIMAECGDVLLAIKENSITEKNIHAEIGEVLARVKPGRTSADEITLYKSVGIAIQDVATAQLVYRKAVERKVGSNVEV